MWRSSLASVRALPPCPPDLTEIQYASLAFDDHCHVRFISEFKQHTTLVILTESSTYLVLSGTCVWSVLDLPCPVLHKMYPKIVSPASHSYPFLNKCYLAFSRKANSSYAFREKQSSRNRTRSFPTLHRSVSISKCFHFIRMENKPLYLIEAFNTGGKSPLYFLPAAKEYLREMDDILLAKDDAAFTKWMQKKKDVQSLRVSVCKISFGYAERWKKKTNIST